MTKRRFKEEQRLKNSVAMSFEERVWEQKNILSHSLWPSWHQHRNELGLYSKVFFLLIMFALNKILIPPSLKLYVKFLISQKTFHIWGSCKRMYNLKKIILPNYKLCKSPEVHKKNLDHGHKYWAVNQPIWHIAL